MTYKLVISEYAYSDQSMRAWLELDAFGIDFGPRYVPMSTEDYDAALVQYAPAAALPVVLMDTPDLPMSIWEHAAAAEILAERHADARLWPRDNEMKEMARSLAARARAGFSALQALPMNLHERYQGFLPHEAQQEDFDQLTALWAWALSVSEGPFLCGRAFCAADAAFAPIVTRLVTYGFTMDETTKAYVETVYAHPAVRRWHACADAQLRKIDDFHLDLPSSCNKEWPRQPTLPGQHYHGDLADAVNQFCPYSGLPIDPESLAEIDGMVVGFCNPFCCRRGMADAESWPTVVAVMRQAPQAVKA